MQYHLIKTSLALLLIVFMPAFAQKASLQGIVTDSETGAPLISANIVFLNESLGTTTGLSGDYNISVAPGTYTVSFHYLGYIERTERVSLSEGQIQTLDIALQPSAVQSDIVVVSAGRFEQNLGELTVSMEVLKPRIIENKNTTSLDEALNQVPGVSIVDNEPQIRSGSGFSFGAGSRVMLLIDDLPILSGDAGRPTWGFFPVENIEQVEVIKGASSVLYGSAALNGVINVRTAYPRSEPTTKVSLFTGYYSDPATAEAKYWEKTALANGFHFLHSRMIGNVDLMIGGIFNADQGHLGPFDRRETGENGEEVVIPYEESSNPFAAERATASTQGRISVNLRHRTEIPGLNYGLNTSWQKAKSINTLLWDSIGVHLYRPFDGAATTTNQLIGYVDPFINYTSPKGTQLSLRGRYSHLNNENDNNQANLSNTYFAEAQLQQDFNPVGVTSFRLTSGVVYSRTDGESQLYTGGDSTGANSAQNVGWYAQIDKKFFNRLNASVGWRLETFEINDSSESKPVFRAGLNYQLGEGTFFRASYGQGYRFPSIAEKFVNTQSGFVVVYPNDSLESETSWNAEVGIKQGFKLGAFGGFLDAAYFHQEYENFIEFTFGNWGRPGVDPFFGLGFSSLNTGKARVTGLDFSLIGEGKIGEITYQTLSGYTYSKPVTLTPHFAYANIRSGPVNYRTTSSDTTKNLLKYRMQHIFRMDVELGYKKLIFGTSYRYNSFMENIDLAFVAFDADPENPEALGLLPSGISEWRRENNSGNHIFDMRFGYKLNSNHKLSLIVKNFFNEEYAIRPLVVESTRKTTLQYSATF